jgi:hypothetical protein
MRNEELIRFKNFKKNEEFSPDFEGEMEMEISSPVVSPKRLPKEVEEVLNERLGDEYTAYYFYRNAANWCKNANYKKATAFFKSPVAAIVSSRSVV